jgi:hypothetical protein
LDLQSRIQSAGEAFRLVIAADHFLMDELKEEAVAIVRRLLSVDQLWPLLDTVCGTGLEHLVQGCFEVFLFPIYYYSVFKSAAIFLASFFVRYLF